MATIRRRNGKYQVQVRVQGCAPLSKTYSRLEDAKAWAQLTEVEAEQIGLPADPRTAGTRSRRPYEALSGRTHEDVARRQKRRLAEERHARRLDEIDPDPEPTMVWLASNGRHSWAEAAGSGEKLRRCLRRAKLLSLWHSRFRPVQDARSPLRPV
jgi:hypothetical protein